MIKKRILAALVAVTTAAGLSLTATVPAQAAGPTIGFIAMHMDSYFTSVQTGLQAAAKKIGGTVIPVSYEDDAGKEAQAFQDLIARKVDVIAVSTISESGSVAGIASAVKAGIPVVCYNSCINATDAKKYVSAFVQSDNTSLGTFTGQYAAKYIKAKLGGKATIGILNCDTYDVCKQRKAGFKAALSAAGIKYTVVSDITSYKADETPAKAEAILTSKPKINVVWSATDGGGTGWISAIKSGNKTGKIAAFSTDMSLAFVPALKSGAILKATTGQDGAGQGAGIVKAAQEAIKAGAGKSIAKYETYIPGVLFTKDDMKKVNAWAAANK